MNNIEYHEKEMELLKKKQQDADNNRKKHSFLYGYNLSEKDYGSHRLVGKKEDVILIGETLQQGESGIILTKKLTPPRNKGNK